MPCPVCQHPDLAEINARLAAGDSLRAMAKEYGFNGHSALHRHRHGCLGNTPAATTPADQTPDIANTGPPPTSQTEPTRNSVSAVSETHRNADETTRNRAAPVNSPGFAVSTMLKGSPFRRVADAPAEGRRDIWAVLEPECLRLRLRGMGYDDIASRLGWHHIDVRRAVERALAKTRRKMGDDAAGLRSLEIARLDKMMEALWERAVPAHGPHGDQEAKTSTGIVVDARDQHRAIELILKLMERRARYEGLDAPSGPSTVVNLLQTDGMRDLVCAIRGYIQQEAPGILPGLDKHLRRAMLQRKAAALGVSVLDGEDNDGSTVVIDGTGVEVTGVAALPPSSDDGDDT